MQVEWTFAREHHNDESMFLSTEFGFSMDVNLFLQTERGHYGDLVSRATYYFATHETRHYEFHGKLHSRVCVS